MTPTSIVALITLIAAQAGRPPLLAGPKVTAQAATEGDSAFNASARPRPAPLGPQRWLRLLRRVDLDTGQRETIRGIVADFRQATDAFRAEHGERLKTLRQEANAAREAGLVLPEDRQLELRRLRETRPNGVDYLRRIWAVLDASQRQRMRDLLTEARKDARRTSG